MFTGVSFMKGKKTICVPESIFINKASVYCSVEHLRLIHSLFARVNILKSIDLMCTVVSRLCLHMCPSHSGCQKPPAKHCVSVFTVTELFPFRGSVFIDRHKHGYIYIFPSCLPL